MTMHGGFELVKVGRKRKAGRRWRNGNRVPERGIDPKTIAALMPHRQSVPAQVRHDPRAETSFGRLRLKGAITEYQYDAGVKYRDIVSRYHAVISAPRHDPISLSGTMIGQNGGGSIIDPETAQRRKSEYDAAFEWLEDHAGNRGARAVARWCVYDENDRPVPDLIRGLNALIAHFGLTGTRKSGQRGNAH